MRKWVAIFCICLIVGMPFSAFATEGNISTSPNNDILTEEYRTQVRTTEGTDSSFSSITIYNRNGFKEGTYIEFTVISKTQNFDTNPILTFKDNYRIYFQNAGLYAISGTYKVTMYSRVDYEYIHNPIQYNYDSSEYENLHSYANGMFVPVDYFARKYSIILDDVGQEGNLLTISNLTTLTDFSYDRLDFYQHSSDFVRYFIPKYDVIQLIISKEVGSIIDESQVQQIINDMSVSRPDVSGSNMDAASYVSNTDINLAAGAIAPLWSNNLINTMLMIVAVLAVTSFFIFGRKN